MIAVQHNIDSFTGQMRARAAVLSQRLIASINDLSIKLQQRILTRPGSPASASHRRKGWLANSVRPIPAEAAGGVVSGGVQGAGGDAWYGRLFEDGITSAYEIMARNKKAMMLALHGDQMILRKVIHPAFDSSKLAFMSPALKDMEAEITAEIQAVTMETLRG
jgi:hypothetical protein